MSPVKPDKARPVRAEAARTLTRVLRQHQSLSDQAASVAESDQALWQELCFGTCRWYFQLQALLALLLHKPFKPKDTDLHALALIGLYQLIHLRIPDHAVVSQTVAACDALGKSWAKKLLNALLRRFVREQTELLDKIQASQSAECGLPEWLSRRLQNDWPNDWETIAQASLQRPPMMLRVNPLRGTREAYLQRLQAEQIQAQPIPHTDSGLILAHPVSVAQLPGFERGDVSVQDGAAQLAAMLLDPKPGLRILDACAAPGGKTAHLLELEPRIQELVALEAQPDRCETLKQTLTRLGLSASIVCDDARHPERWHQGALFDRILLDAPCSATGVIRRHPDIKLLRQEAEIARIADIQRQLLQALWRCLKPAGVLLYTTCSILKQENEQQLLRFLTEQSDATESPLAADWGIQQKVGRQRLPGEDDMDGFYYARLVKQS